MFFLFPTLILGVPLFYVLLAVIPAIALLVYVYNQDSIEHEPGSLLANLFLRAIAAGFIAMIVEMILTKILDISTTSYFKGTAMYVVITAFLVVAVVEEGAKYALMAQRTWNDPNFNFRFDGIVYAVFTSLGFAAMENIGYVFNYGAGVVVSRALLSIPGHMAFAVVFGIFYGRARMQMNRGNRTYAIINNVTGYVLSVLLHGFYDTCCMLQTNYSTIAFVAVVVVIYIIVFILVKKEARTDHAI